MNYLGFALLVVIVPLGAFDVSCVNRNTDDCCRGDIVIEMGINTIETNAFKGCTITNVVIPNTITLIGDSAFANNQLTNLIIPESVTFIGDSAFENNPLAYVCYMGPIIPSYSFSPYIIVEPCPRPTSQPSGQPSEGPTGQPSGEPSGEPTGQPYLL